jgi:hypothetical protein
MPSRANDSIQLALRSCSMDIILSKAGNPEIWICLPLSDVMPEFLHQKQSSARRTLSRRPAGSVAEG